MGKKKSIGNGLKFSLIVHHWTGEIEYTAQRQAAHVILNLQVIKGRKKKTWIINLISANVSTFSSNMKIANVLQDLVHLLTYALIYFLHQPALSMLKYI